MPREEEMLPKDKYTLFDKKEKSYRKSIHSTSAPELRFQYLRLPRALLMVVSLCRVAQVDSCQPACEPSWILSYRRHNLPYFYNRHTLYGSPIRELESKLYYTPDALPLYLHSMAGLGSNNIGRISGVFGNCENAAALTEDAAIYTCSITQRLDQIFFFHNPIIVQKKNVTSAFGPWKASMDRKNSHGR